MRQRTDDSTTVRPAVHLTVSNRDRDGCREGGRLSQVVTPEDIIASSASFGSFNVPHLGGASSVFRAGRLKLAAALSTSSIGTRLPG